MYEKFRSAMGAPLYEIGHQYTSSATSDAATNFE
jgi:hypothetical protein